LTTGVFFGPVGGTLTSLGIIAAQNINIRFNGTSTSGVAFAPPTGKVIAFDVATGTSTVNQAFIPTNPGFSLTNHVIVVDANNRAHAFDGGAAIELGRADAFSIIAGGAAMAFPQGAAGLLKVNAFDDSTGAVQLVEDRATAIKRATSSSAGFFVERRGDCPTCNDDGILLFTK
jgi:hypothetical protein